MNSTLSKSNYYHQCVSDVISIVIAYILAWLWKFKGPSDASSFFLPSPPGTYRISDYIVLFCVVLFGYFIVSIFSLRREDYIHRNLSTELKSTTKTVAYVVFLIMVFLYFSRTSLNYSREFLGMFILLFWLFVLFFRNILRKKILPARQKGKNADRLIVVGSQNILERRLDAVSPNEDWRYRITGLIVIDRDDLVREYIHGVEVVTTKKDMFSYISTHPVDAVMIIPGTNNDSLRKTVRQIYDLGKTVYVDYYQYNFIPNANYSFEKVGECDTLCYTPIKGLSTGALVTKRIFDVLISLLFLPLYVIVLLLSLILINIESPGPMLLKRIRVGKNGRRFYQYRFRIFRMDAARCIEEGKNPMTIWGRFLSFSHLDRLPIILNVLISDMSIVGPHAARVVRFMEFYGTERRKNLCIRPGIIGGWSFELDERKIIPQERAYIEHWNFAKDCSLVLQFIICYITGTLPRHYDPLQADEEISLIAEYIEGRRPLEYDHTLYSAPRGFKIGAYHFIKRLLDIILSGLAIVILSPLLLVLGILVMLDDGGSPFYSHNRIGQYGKRIHIYKFRSMRIDAGDLEKLLTPAQIEQYKKEFKIDNDPRITKIGSILRRTSLDELPQLFNIFGGSLSIIGPRPIVEEETHIYGKDIGKFLSVKPGLTGYWQAYARNNATYETGERQMMEMYYIDHASLWFDIQIFFKTIGSVIRENGAK